MKLSKQDGELRGVLAHEASHVDRAHGLQSAYQASLIPAAIAFITGDVTQVGQIAAILPGVLLQSAYSREFKAEADADADALMMRTGKSSKPMAELLLRVEDKMCNKKGCLPRWLGSHPSTAERVRKLRGP